MQHSNMLRYSEFIAGFFVCVSEGYPVRADGVAKNWGPGAFAVGFFRRRS